MAGSRLFHMRDVFSDMRKDKAKKPGRDEGFA
jgi:hypothetical protein